MIEDLINDINILKNILVSHATGGTANPNEYKELRERLIYNSVIKDHLPRFLKTCRTPGEFWGYIKEQASTYQGRRDHLRDEFDPVLTLLEQMEQEALHKSPIDELVSTTIKESINYEYIQKTWQKALDRRKEDPEGAITMARSLIETTCKHIMDEANHPYDDKVELPQLYKEVQSVLNLAPSEHTEQIFKMILSGCVSVITGLGSLRNKLSDSHGKGQYTSKPSARHAQLAVNLSGTMAEFLILTWAEIKEKRN